MNQDARGQQGALTKEMNGTANLTAIQVYARSLLGGAVAVAVFNRGSSNATAVPASLRDSYCITIVSQ